ncbi:MAG: hypothetical protein PHQ66_01705 [Candidatus Nanoarchaeia archaeon]|nr:hypothetical protein [Candidatus Nanoarchaeia archaeon]MDD5357911.1 hypothetical protein [Candidatus Nanoarchaeia archaeon]MDD5588830.1 hypothetical protein [Candidatus Nanoarchaeia archaeon]
MKKLEINQFLLPLQESLNIKLKTGEKIPPIYKEKIRGYKGLYLFDPTSEKPFLIARNAFWALDEMRLQGDMVYPIEAASYLFNQSVNPIKIQKRIKSLLNKFN